MTPELLATLITLAIFIVATGVLIHSNWTLSGWLADAKSENDKLRAHLARRDAERDDVPRKRCWSDENTKVFEIDEHRRTVQVVR